MTQSADEFYAQVRAVDAAFDGEIGLAATNLLTGETLAHNAERAFSLASIIKVVVLVAALRLVQRGELHLQTRHPVYPAARTKGSGILKDLEDGLSLSLRDLL